MINYFDPIPMKMHPVYFENDFAYRIPAKLSGKKIVNVRNSAKNPKIGRNDLCLCGSGLKYKHCCINHKS